MNQRRGNQILITVIQNGIKDLVSDSAPYKLNMIKVTLRSILFNYFDRAYPPTKSIKEMVLVNPKYAQKIEKAARQLREAIDNDLISEGEFEQVANEDFESKELFIARLEEIYLELLEK